MKETIVVMVTGIGGGGNGEQILKALRMARTKYLIIGCDMSRYSRGLKFVDHPYLVPSATDPNYVDCILSICKKHDVNALFPGSEPELKVFSEARDIIRNEGIFLPINPKGVIDACMDKIRTFDFLEKNGFPYPKVKRLRNLKDIKGWLYFPSVLKPSIGSGGSINTFIVQNQKELELLAKYILTMESHPGIIVQEYVGSPESEYTVGVLFDMDGNLINSIAVKRDLSSSLSRRMKVPNYTGAQEYGPNLVISSGISQGEIGLFPEVTSLCEEVAKTLGACGSINIQCRAQRGQVFIFEINPRFSGTTSMRAMVGFNEPDILIRKHLLGENITLRFPYENAVVTRGLEETLFKKEHAEELTDISEYKF